MRRVVVLGGPGSGKSTVARALGERIGAPVIHLDRLFFDPGWTPRPKAAFLADVEAAHAGEAWVSEGNYGATWPVRFARTDTLVFLDVVTPLRLWRVLRRIAGGYGRVRADMAPGCPEQLDLAFLRFVVEWRGERRRAGLAAVREARPGLDAHVLRTRPDVAAFLAAVPGSPGAARDVRPTPRLAR
ncbi:MAG: AAA family ATPase [Paracoccaceae bacterium]